MQLKTQSYMVVGGKFSLLHESGVFAPGSVKQILSGKDFDRTLCVLRVVDEVFLFQFKTWYDSEKHAIPQQSADLLKMTYAVEQTNIDVVMQLT